jgi:hypothetical protein
MIRAYRLYTGPDGHSHVVRGSVSDNHLVKAESILFKETPAHSSYDWHNDPIPQYVITLAGVLEFTTVGGETFTLRPGEEASVRRVHTRCRYAIHTGSGLSDSERLSAGGLIYESSRWTSHTFVDVLHACVRTTRRR